MRGSYLGKARLRRVAALVALLGVVGALGVVTGPARAEGGGPNAEDFCPAWDAIAAAHENGQTNVQVALSNGTVVSASEAMLSGTSCAAPDAGIEMSGAALAEAPAAGSGASSGQSTAPTLAEGLEFLTNVWIDNLSLTWTPASGITLSGTLHIRYSGGQVNLRFAGSFLNPDNWSVSISSPAGGTSLPMIESSPVSFSGSFGVTQGDPFFSASASVSSVQLGSATLENLSFAADLVGTDVVVQMTADLTAGQFGASADLAYSNAGGNVVLDVAAALELSTTPPSSILVAGSLDADGNLTLLGAGDVALGGHGMAGFSLQVTGMPGGPVQVVAGGSFSVTAEDLAVSLSGSLGAATDGSVSFNLTGSADFKFGYYNVKSGRFTLAGSQDSAQANVRFSILAFGFVPVNMAAYFNPDGSYKRVHVPFGLLGYILFGNVAKSACKCQVTF